jgi:DNA topoisomerase-2
MMDYLKFKEEFRERQELKDISKKISSKKIDKFYPPIGKNKYLVLGEGDSAVNGLMKVLGRSEFGYFPLRGKPLNCLEVPISKIGTNAETSNVINILDLDLTKQSDTMSFDNVLIATDADADGISIRGLLLAFFYRMTPELLKSGKIKFLKTPLVAVYNKKTLECHKWFFTLSEYTKWQGDHETESHKYKHQYYKGLGTWVEKDLKAIFAKDGLDKFIFDCTLDHEGNDSINEWMGKAFADTRKSKLTDMSFDINAI